MNRIKLALLAFLLAPALGLSEPFLSSAVYLATSPQPTEFLVSIDDGPEAKSAAVGVRQVTNFSITAYDAATTYRATIGGVNVDQLGTGGTTTTTAAAMVTALNASADANFKDITWSNSWETITGKHDIGGTAFTLTTSVVSGTGTIGAPTTTVLSTGKALFFDLANIPFGSHVATVKARNATTTSAAATRSFNTGVEVPHVIVIPGAP